MKSAALINSPGGLFTPKDLQHCACAAKQHGLYFGQRQNIIIPDVYYKHRELRKLSASVRSEDYYNHTYNNIVCSHAAGGLSRENDWAYLNETYLEILTQLPPLKLKVNLCSREQSLFPLFSGQLNFITADQEGYWHLLINFTDKRQLLPFLLRSNQVHQAIELIERQYQSDALLDAEKIMDLLVQHLIIDSQQHALKLHAKPRSDYEGFQQMKNGKFSLNIFSNHHIWNPKFISELCDMASRQGLARIYLTTGRSLLIKHIEEHLCFAWQNLIGRHNVTLRHSEQDLSWIVPAEKRELVHIKEKIIERLHAGGLSFLGLYIALDPDELECGAQIIIRSHKQVDKYSYQVFHKEEFDYRRNLFIHDGSELGFEQLLETLYSLRKQFFQRESMQDIVVMQALKATAESEEALDIYQCPNCLTQYHEKVGLPHMGIAAGTLFKQLPANWVCELCETHKAEFSKVSKVSESE